MYTIPSFYARYGVVLSLLAYTIHCIIAKWCHSDVSTICVRCQNGSGNSHLWADIDTWKEVHGHWCVAYSVHWFQCISLLFSLLFTYMDMHGIKRCRTYFSKSYITNITIFSQKFVFWNLMFLLLRSQYV